MKKFQIKAIILFVFALTMPLTAADKAVKRQASAKKAKVYIISPKDGKTLKNGKVRVVFGLSGMGVCPATLAGPDGKPLPNTGHHHLLLDAKEMPPMNAPLAAADTLLHYGGGQTETVLDLKPGTHTLQLVFADWLHIPHDPPLISKKITITVK
ncbi:MAG: DUF4399 domain-containing protein [Verrucomicrobiota bacterium]|jgi:hypothetical protein|nr:DUF4399 domain-containing protein [Verrucomicrobiota bacterium]